MNVLLAEANVAYEQLLELEHVNGLFDSTDVALIVGANDVVNPAAREDKSSPIYGMNSGDGYRAFARCRTVEKSATVARMLSGVRQLRNPRQAR